MLKASKLSTDDAESQEGGTSTSNADAILEQLRMMNQARHPIYGDAPDMAVHLYTAGQPTPAAYVPDQMCMQTASMVQMQQMGAQMYPAHLHGHQLLAHYPHQLPIGQQQQHMFSTHQGLPIAHTQQHMLSSHHGVPQPPQIHQMYQMHQMQHMPHHMQPTPVTAVAGHMQHQAVAYAPTMFYAPNTANASSPYMDQHQMGLWMQPAYCYPGMQMACDTDGVAATTMMGLCRSHELTCEAVIEDDDPAE